MSGPNNADTGVQPVYEYICGRLTNEATKPIMKTHFNTPNINMSSRPHHITDDLNISDMKKMPTHPTATNPDIKSSQSFFALSHVSDELL